MDQDILTDATVPQCTFNTTDDVAQKHHPPQSDRDVENTKDHHDGQFTLVFRLFLKFTSVRILNRARLASPL